MINKDFKKEVVYLVRIVIFSTLISVQVWNDNKESMIYIVPIYSLFLQNTVPTARCDANSFTYWTEYSIIIQNVI